MMWRSKKTLERQFKRDRILNRDQKKRRIYLGVYGDTLNPPDEQEV
jgi:hypothetical protein